ncbi:MAG: hypothetical protein OK474_03215 [Thaumarchaeota archaeon]|nr:hypothetical protein [Nitrososphaerota archaeon]
MANPDVFSRLYGSIGRSSRYAGLGFIALSVVFLVLAVSDQFIVFEIDSIVAFLAAIFLLFRDPRARAQVRVLDAIMESTDESIAELSAFSDAGFTYLQTGNGVGGVVVVPEQLEDAAVPDGDHHSDTPFKAFTPPGRRLALLYVREVGLTQITMDALSASLSGTMQENFGLADYTDIVSTNDSVKVTLHGASTTCACETDQTRPASKGSIGCTLASFLAVLVCAATKRPLTLEPCVHDVSADEWTVSMDLKPDISASEVPVNDIPVSDVPAGDIPATDIPTSSISVSG